MKTIILTLFSSILAFSSNSQEILKKENGDNLFHIFSNLHVRNIHDIETNSNYFAKTILINSNIEVSNNDEGHDKKQYFYLLIANYGEYPEGVLLKSKLLNQPKFKVN